MKCTFNQGKSLVVTFQYFAGGGGGGGGVGMVNNESLAG